VHQEEKPGFLLPFTQSLAHLTALPGGKNLLAGQVALAGGGMVVTTIVL